MCKLTKAGKVYRGTCYGKLPEEFWVPNAEGVLGGIEFGFQSTTRDRNQAVHYATGGGYAKDGDAMTLFEMNMGMIDRGAELTWFSQYPHEREVLLPPLTGIEPVQTAVDGQKLEIFARLSLNLAAQTLEQVLSRRRRMLLDMKEGIIIEIKRSGILRAELVAPDGRKLWGNISSNMGTSRDVGRIYHGCPSPAADADLLTDEEYDACQQWEGVVYALNKGEPDLMPSEGEKAPERILMTDLGRKIRYSDVVTGPGEEPWDVFDFKRCVK
jgi:hypothetical protein